MFCKLRGERELDGLVFETFFFNLAESGHFVLGPSLQPGEYDLLRFDIAFAFAEFDFVGVEFFLRTVVLVENVAPRVSQHVEEDLGLNLILRCLDAGQ